MLKEATEYFTMCKRNNAVLVHRRGLALAALLLVAQVAGLVPAAGAVRLSEFPAVRADHPRLGLRPEGTSGARTVAVVRGLFQQNENFQNYFAPALASAEEALKRPAADDRRRGLPHVYAACWVVTGDDRFAEAAIERLLKDTITPTYQGGYYSTVWAYALAYDWLYNHPMMTPQRRAAIEERIGSILHDELLELDSSYPAMWHGRNQLGNNTLVAALSLSVHPDREELQQRAMVHFAEGIRALAMTQGWPEGPSYWMNNRHFPYALAADCFMTATGETSIAGIDLRETIRQTAYWHLYAMKPDGTMDRFGDAYSQGPANTPVWQAVQDYYARITRDPGVVASADYFRGLNENPYHRWRYAWSAVLTYDPGIPMPEGYDPRRPADYLNAHLPHSRVFGRSSMGHVYLTEGWGDPNALWISFKAGDVLAHHGHYDQGHFTIYRGSPLAMQSGYYADYFSPYRLAYFIQTVSANSILVDAPGEFSNFARGRGEFDEVTGGQRVLIPTGVDLTSVDDWLRNQHAGVHYEAGDLLACEFLPDTFDYCAADITEAYNSTRYAAPGNPVKVSSVTRKFAYLRQPDVVVVFDRVVTTDPSYRTRWLLHTSAKPESERETLLEGESPDDGILTTGDRWFRTTYEEGRLFHQVLLPEVAQIRKIGGPSYRDYVELSGGGQNLQPQERQREMPPSYGLWRTEVIAQQGQDHLFLNVLWPRLAAERAPEQAQLVPMAPPGVAVAAGGWIVVFRTEGEQLSSFSYEAPEGVTTHLIVDLKPRSAWQVETPEGAQQLIASDEGVLSFPARAGPIRVVYVPPRNGIGHH